MKRCFKCGLVKELSEFYPHKRMMDGHLNKCKTCTKSDVSARAQVKLQDPDWVAAERERCRIKQEAYRKAGLAAPVSRESRERWMAKNAHKVKAERAVANAHKRMKVKPPEHCSKCGQPGDLERHHPDYSKPLEIEWLCTGCHGLTRRK